MSRPGVNDDVGEGEATAGAAALDVEAGATAEAGAESFGAAEQKQEDAADKHEKKIVGYWEDGLAIYEDGSREEKTVATSSESDNQNSADGDGFWEESFGGHRDSKPHGPASVGQRQDRCP